MTAYTANRVTGDMPVINWNEYSSKWPYLRKLNFPVPSKKPIVDILISHRLDFAGSSLCNRRGTRSTWGTSSETDAVGIDVHR